MKIVGLSNGIILTISSPRTTTNSKVLKATYKNIIKLKKEIKECKDDAVKSTLIESLHYCREDVKNIMNRHTRYNITFTKGSVTLPFDIACIFSCEKNNPYSFHDQLKTALISFKHFLLEQDVKPFDAKKYVGIEIEFCTEKEKDIVYRELSKFNNLQIKYDGSLRPKDNEYGYEVAILVKETALVKELKPIIDCLNKLGAKTEDRRCGLHVHLDMRRRNRDLVYHNLVSSQPLLKKLTSPIRHNNEFCRDVKSKKFPKKFNGSRQERYKVINAASYFKHKTLEVRVHESSTDFPVVLNWVTLLIKIANYNKKFVKATTSLTTLKKYVKMNTKLMRELSDRMCYWQVNNPRSTNEVSVGLTTRPTTNNTVPANYLINYTELALPEDPGFADNSEEQDNV